MKKLLGLSVVVVLVLFAVSACSVSLSGGATLSGTVSFFNMDLGGNPFVTIQQGSNVYGVSVSYSGPWDGTQVGSFSFSDLPSGTYSLVVEFLSYQSTWVPEGTVYWIDSVGPYPLAPTGSVPYWTAAIYGISVQNDVTVDTMISHIGI